MMKTVSLPLTRVALDRALPACLAALLAAGCVSAAVTPADDPVPGDVAFVNVTVIPMTAGDTVLRDHTVIVREDRIVALGPSRLVRPAQGTQLVEGAGRHLIPGLIDAHVHLEHFEDPALLALFLASGVTTVRNMDGRPHILEWKRRIAAGELAGPTIRSAGPVLDGDPPILPDNARIASPAAARAAVAEHAAAGYDYIKVYTNLPADAYAALVEESRALGIPVVGHVPRQARLEAVLDAAGVHRSIEHLADFSSHVESEDSPFRGRFHWSKLYLAMPADSARMAALASRLAAAGTWVVPTLVQADRALAPADSVRAWLATPAVRRIPADGRRQWEERALRGAGRLDAGDWVTVERGRQNRRQLVRVLHRSGVHLALGTDTPNPFVVPGVAVHDELANLVAAGLSNLDALAAATRDAARLIDSGGDRGTIRVGSRADLVLLAASPLADIGHARMPLGVMHAGRWRSAETLARMLP